MVYPCFKLKVSSSAALMDSNQSSWVENAGGHLVILHRPEASFLTPYSAQQRCQGLIDYLELKRLNSVFCKSMGGNRILALMMANVS